MKKEWYTNWHNNQKHIFVHWAFFVVVVFLVGHSLVNIIDVTFNFAGADPAQTDKQGPKASSDSFLVKVGKVSNAQVKDNPSPKNTGLKNLDLLNTRHNIQKFERVAKKNSKAKTDAAVFQWYKVSISPQDAAKINISNSKTKSTIKTKIEEIMDEYKRQPNVTLVEPNYIVTTSAVPNDPYYSSSGSWGQAYGDLWGMSKINAAGAWDQSTGSANIIVADIDTGVDYNHPDLAANMWLNTAETPGNGVDDDQNGYIDDHRGWDFHNNDNDPMDDHGHGSHTVGTIAGVGNNSIGIVGVNWNAKVMALKFLNYEGSGSLDNGILALQYAADNGARVSSNSWGCGCNSSAMDDAIKYEHDRGMVVAVAAGNSNDDTYSYSPASSNDSVTVAATDPDDARSSFSNWGERIDVAAPGRNILSVKAAGGSMCGAGIILNSLYCYVSGTSMATPHVAGLATLILSKNPSLSNEEVRQILRLSAADLGVPGKDKDYGYGRIDASIALSMAGNNLLAPYISSPLPRAAIGGTSLNITGQMPGPNFASYKVEIGSGRAPTSWTTIKTSTTQVSSNGTLATIDPSQLSDGQYIIRLTATDTTGKNYQFQAGDLTVHNFNLGIQSPTQTTAKGQIPVIGTVSTEPGLGFSNYKLEYSQGGGWTTISTGSQPVTNGQLGIWNTSQLADLVTYTLRLTVTAVNGVSSNYSSQVQIDSTIMSGFPKGITGSTQTHMISDLDGDGKKEIIVVNGNNYNQDYLPTINAYRYDGNQQPGFPMIMTIPSEYINTSISSPVLIVDINSDGKQEIIVQRDYITNGFSLVTKLHVYQSNGQQFSGWVPPTIAAGWTYYLDVNGDGTKEISTIETSGSYLSGQYTLRLRAFANNGSSLTGFPKSASYTFPVKGLYATIPAIVDLDNDGKIEIAWAKDDSVYLYDENLQLLPGWPYILPSTGNASTYRSFSSNTRLTNADFLGDGKKEIFFYNNMDCAFQGGCGIPYNPIVVGLRKDGTHLPGWPKSAIADGYTIWTSYTPRGVSHADVNGDGADDIIVPSLPLAIYTKVGKSVYPSSGYVGTEIHIADVDGDGKPEYASTNETGQLYIKNDVDYLGTGGAADLWVRNIDRSQGTPLLADLDGDGKLEVIAINYSGAPSIYVWRLNFGQPSQHDWPMDGQNPMRDNNLHMSSTPPPPPPPAPTLTLSANPTSIQSGQSSTLSWSTTNATSCTASGGWTGTKPTSGTQSVSPTANTTYTLACTGSGGGATQSATITVATLPPPPAKGHINLTPSSLSFTSTANGPAPTPRTLALSNSGTASLNWTAAMNASWCHVSPTTGTTAVGASSQLSVTVDQSNTVGSTSCTLTATDASADNSPQTAAVTYVVSADSTADTTPPTVSITSPATSSSLKKNANTTIKATAADNVGVIKVEFYVDNVLKCTDSASAYTCAWKPGTAGTFQLAAKAYDAKGNVGTSATINVTAK